MVDHDRKSKPASGADQEWWPWPLGDRVGAGLREPRSRRLQEPRARRSRGYTEKRPPWLEARHIRKSTRGRRA